MLRERLHNVFVAVFFACFCAATVCSVHGSSVPAKSKVVLILVDGVRWDYLNRDDTLQGFKELEKKGVRAKHNTPILPANSYPNWYTIVTGKYPEDHGFVQNYMYDEKTNDFFLMAPDPGASSPHWWNHAEPIWITAEKNNLKTGMYWWDGCQVEIKGKKVTDCMQYQEYWKWDSVNEDTTKKLSEILNKFQKKELDFALVYYEAPDANGHKFGPDSTECRQAVRNASTVLEKFQKEIEERKMENEVSLVVVSDHGMTYTDESRASPIKIEDYISLDDIEFMLDRGSFSMLRPKKDKIEDVYKSLKDANLKGLYVYKRDDIPERFHLKKSYLTQPILLMADKGYFIEGFTDGTKMRPIRDGPGGRSVGGHGYNPEKTEDMRGIFLARGPALKAGYSADEVTQVDHYNLVCKLLGIDPLQNSGNKERTDAMFASSGRAIILPYLLLLPVVASVITGTKWL